MFCILELETEGANFLKGTDDWKELISCQLSDPTSWLSADVTMKVTQIGGANVISCKTAGAAGSRTFGCTSPTVKAEFDVETVDPAKVQIPFKYKGTDTGQFRCEVTVEDTTSAVMIYAEALRIEPMFVSDNFKFLNGERYLISASTADGDAVADQDADVILKFQIYGDNADPKVTTDDDLTKLEAKYKWKVGGAITVGDVTTETAFTSDPEEEMSIKFSDMKSKIGANYKDTETYSITIKKIEILEDTTVFMTKEFTDPGGELKFNIYPNCAAGTFYDATKKTCEACTKGVRKDADDQFMGCVPCDPLKCPASTFATCADRTTAQISLGGWVCNNCPKGTERVEADNICKACEIGKASAKGETCDACDGDTGLYAPAEGFSECQKCNGFVKDNQCTPCEPGKGVKDGVCEECEAGQHSPKGFCLSCAKGHFQGATGKPSCDPCTEGFYTDEEKQTECKPCLISDKKFTLYAEGADKTGATECTVVSNGHYIEKKTVGDKIVGIATKECAKGTYRIEESPSHTECQECDHTKGEYQTAVGQSECSDVTGGYYLTSATADPVKCEAGKYRDQTNTDYEKCQVCEHEKGEYQTSTGEAVCLSVADGYYLTGADAAPVICAKGKYRNDKSRKFTECQACDTKKGEYQTAEGKAECSIVADGRFLTTATDAPTPCAAGTARRNAEDYTKCAPCSEITYQADEGQSICGAVPEGHTRVSAIKVEQCPVGKKEEEKKCVECMRASGEYSINIGSTFCKVASPGKKLDSNTEGPVDCPAGTFGNSSYECEDCNTELGQYQDGTGSPYCKLVEPGYQLNPKYPATSAPLKCDIGTYSKGSAKVCTPCDYIKKEYQNDEGSTYCKICAKGEVNEAGTECKGVNCLKQEVTKIEIRDEPFIFSETASDEYLTIPCAETGTNHEERITRFCSFNVEDKTASWGIPNFSKCATKKTKELMEVQKNLDKLADPTKLSADDLTSLMGDVSAQMDSTMDDPVVDEGAPVPQLTSRDVTDVVSTFGTMTNIFDIPDDTTTAEEEAAATKNMTETEKETYTKKKQADKANVKKAKTALKKSMAKSISKVAVSGGDTLATVDNDKKKEIISAVDSLAGSMKAGEDPIVTTTLAVEQLSFSTSTDKEGEDTAGTESQDIALPVPDGMNATEAPKLELGAAASAGASVAVFSEGAKDMFPDPKDAIDDDLEETTDEDIPAEEKPKANRTLNSCIVSLKFTKSDTGNNATKSFTLKMKANVSDDVGFKKDKKALKRTCTFLNTTTTKWSSVGCKTYGPDKNGNINCTCDHTTSFAILLSISDIVDKSQETASAVFFYFNIIFLALTFFAIAPFKKHRKRALMVLQTQLVLSLIVANIGFHVLSETTKIQLDEFKRPLFSLNKQCIIGVIIVQYLFLCVMAWMTCCSYTLYGKIVDAVKTFGKQDRNYVLKCVLGCWIVPAVFPLTGYLTAALMNDLSQESRLSWPTPYIGAAGVNKAPCWVDAPWKWVSFMLPCYICLVFNCVVFFMIAKVLYRAMKRKVGSSGYGKQIKGLITIAVTVGLPWIVGLMTFEPMALIGQWLFIILTGLQGLVMFITFVVLQEEVLSTIISPCGLTVPEILKSPKSTSESSRRKTTLNSLIDREKIYDPKKVDPELAATLEKVKEEEESAKNDEGNVYCNQAAEVEVSENTTTNDNAILVGEDSPDPTVDHTYYECTHFPYDPDAVSLASQFPEPIME